MHVYRAPAMLLVLRGLSVLILCCTFDATAAILEGDVVGITDGDTVTLLDASKVQFKIRLAGIDAPEKRQPFGQRSQQNLAALVFQRRVTVEWFKYDRYGRVIGKIVVGGQDANLTQVAAGMAWHYKAYQREQSPADRERYAAAEDKARASRTGLWSEPNPTAPWDFRHFRR